MKQARFRAAEFFAGIGLVRGALETCGIDVVWANDIDPAKQALYRLNFGDGDLQDGDVRDVRGADIPPVEIATASFPCTDLSLAGNRKGLAGQQSGMFWEFVRTLREMEARRPRVVMLENVPSFASSRGGADLYEAVHALNQLDYVCDLFVVDARYFVPQSRPRLFIVGATQPVQGTHDWRPSELRPAWILAFRNRYPRLRLMALPLSLPVNPVPTLADVVERLPASDSRWWDEVRLARFVDSLSPLQRARLDRMRAPTLLQTHQADKVWATAYRRTRHGSAVWEIRPDSISGCLRTARGGSSKQALVEAGDGELRVRWMTAREYARLQGAPDYRVTGATELEALFGFGDAVCMPVVRWITESYVVPLLSGDLAVSPALTAKAG